MAFEAVFIESLAVERSECRCQATKRPDQLELRGDDLADQAELRLVRKLEAPFGLTLRLCQRISSGEKIGVQIVAAVRGKREVAGLVRDIECAAHQVTAGRRGDPPTRRAMPLPTPAPIARSMRAGGRRLRCVPSRSGRGPAR